MTHTHFIGIGGTGLSAIARVLLERGETVSGSDRTYSPLAANIQSAGAEVFIGHAAENVRGADVVVRSSAVPDENVEVVAARQAGIPVLKRSDYLGQLLAGQLVIAVAGTHGKTTTTSMVVWMLHKLGLNPGFIVGGQVQDLGTNAAAGGGEIFVIEADEYDHMFWGLKPTIAVVTNVEHDHIDCFPTPEDFRQAFEGFVDRITSDGSLVTCLDDPGNLTLLNYAANRNQHWLAYSLENEKADYLACQLATQAGAGYAFEVMRGGGRVAEVSLRVPGKHNVRNALAALVAADLLNLDLMQAAQALSSFHGAGRRFEILGESAGVLVVDDYGHHPTEIAATLQAARASYPDRRIWVVWQPHTYTRTLRWLPEFGKAFGEADQVIVTGVYAAREIEPDGFSLQTVAGAVLEPAGRGIQNLDEATRFLLENLQAGDLLIVFSAGDATRVSAGVLAGLMAREDAA